MISLDSFIMFMTQWFSCWEGGREGRRESEILDDLLTIFVAGSVHKSAGGHCLQNKQMVV